MRPTNVIASTTTRPSPLGHVARTLIARLAGRLMQLHRSGGRMPRGYRPERYYLRGPGPACRARNGLPAD